MLNSILPFRTLVSSDKIKKFVIFLLSVAGVCYLSCCCLQILARKFTAENENRLRVVGPLDQDDDTVIEMLKSKYLDRPSLKNYNFSKDTLYTKMKNYFSWPFIHHYLKAIFLNKTEGFFVEAGALDGEYLSNTLWFEKELNWTGILIEPDPYNYKELLSKNRKAWASNTCLSSKPYPKEIIFVSRRQNKHIGSDPWVFRGSSHELGYTLPPLYDQFFARTSFSFMKVQCFPLFSYLLALNRTHIDLLSLDIQGSEVEVIQTLPFEKIRIKVLVIEHPHSKGYDKTFVNYIEGRGYKLIACSGDPDYLFISRNEFKDRNFQTINRCYP